MPRNSELKSKKALSNTANFGIICKNLKSDTIKLLTINYKHIFFSKNVLSMEFKSFKDRIW